MRPIGTEQLFYVNYLFLSLVNYYGDEGNNLCNFIVAKGKVGKVGKIFLIPPFSPFTHTPLYLSLATFSFPFSPSLSRAFPFYPTFPLSFHQSRLLFTCSLSSSSSLFFTSKLFPLPRPFLCSSPLLVSFLFSHLSSSSPFSLYLISSPFPAPFFSAFSLSLFLPPIPFPFLLLIFIPFSFSNSLLPLFLFFLFRGIEHCSRIKKCLHATTYSHT